MSDIGTQLDRLLVQHELGVPGDGQRLARGEPPAHGGGEQRLALVAFDPLGIQDTVLASPRMVTVTGASDRLARWDDELERSSREEGFLPLFAGGAQGVFLGPAEHAPALEEKLVASFRSKLHSSAAAAHLVVTPAELATGPRPMDDGHAQALRSLGIDAGGGGGFGGLLAVLHVRLREAKDRLVRQPFKPFEGPRCGECGVRPAEKKPPWSGDRKWVCVRCHAFHQHGSGLGRADGSNGRRPVTLEDLWGGPAYVVIDGARVGSALARQTRLDQYHAFSQALSSAFNRRAIDKALARVVTDARDFVARPWIPVVAGGDDLRLVLAAGARDGEARGPVEIAIELAERIEQTFREHLDRSPWTAGEAPELAVGVGVAVAPKIPPRQGFALAYELCRSAKRRVADAGGSAIDFEVMSGTGLVATTLSDIRAGLRRRFEMYPGKVKGKPYLQLYRRPLSLSEARHLRDMSRRIGTGDEEAGEAPSRSALYRARTALDREPMEGLALATYLLRAHPDFGLGPHSPGANLEEVDSVLLRREPWTAAEERVWTTAIPDLVDLVKLRERRGQGGDR